MPAEKRYRDDAAFDHCAITPCPVVGTSCISEVVEDGRSGLVAPDGSPQALAGAIARVIDDSPERRAFVAAGIARVAERFSIPAMVESMCGVYRDALEARAA